MQGGTHLLIGFTTGAALASYWNMPVFGPTPGVFLGAMIGSLAPDIDHAGSRISRAAGCLALPVRLLARLGLLHHRGFTHSLMAVALLVVLLGALHVDYILSASFVAGYGSHLLADAVTPAGIQFFFPFERKIRVLPRFMTIPTGSIFEMCIALASMVVAIVIVGRL